MNHPNGRAPGGPLNLTNAERILALRKLGLAEGWLLLSVSEMFGMKKAMEGATSENERLNKQAARLTAAMVTAHVALGEAKTVLETAAEHLPDPTMRIDALNAAARIDAALSTGPKPPQPEGRR